MAVETHRATLFQDIWRTVRFVEQRPRLRFTADLSHWYTGLELVYGGIERKLAFITPVLDRVDSMHGRIGDPGCMQVDIGQTPWVDAPPYVEHFRTMWGAPSTGSSPDAAQRPTSSSRPSCFPLAVYYGRQSGGREASDRWTQALVPTALAREISRPGARRRASSRRGPGRGRPPGARAKAR